MSVLILGLAKLHGEDLPDGVQLVAPGVWFLEGDLSKGYANTTLIEMPDSLIVVDANYPGRAKDLLAILPKISPKPVKYVFDTHAHGDHAYGNAIWTAAGAQTMAFAGVKSDMDRWEPGRWRAAMSAREDVRETGQDDVERPQKIIDGDRFTLTEGSRVVEFLYFGWGHTQGDGYVWLPKERVLVTGDAAVNGPYTYLADAWIEHWPRVLEAAIQLRPDVVLPGHGPVGGPEILVGQRRFLIDLYRAVEEQVKFHRTPRQMRIILPEWDKPWVPTNLMPEIQATYAEIRNHVPAGLIEREGK
jgi:cyclase